MIYFVEGQRTGMIKIGVSRRLSARLLALRAEAGEALDVLGVMRGDRAVERSTHERFSHLRVVGEWFRPGADLRDFIASEAHEWDGVDEVPPKRYGTLVRVSDHLADALKAAASFEGIGISEHCDIYLLAIVERLYADAVKEKARELEGLMH